MRFFQQERLISLLKNERVLVGTLLVAFFLKGVFLAALFPMFTGQDEARHYNTLQYLNEPPEKTWATEDRGAKTNRSTFSEYNFSEEILNTGTAAGLDSLRGGLYNTTPFAAGSFDGPNESTITANKWPPYNHYVPADTAGGGSSLYHHIAAAIERTLSGSDILVRFYSIRLFSVLLGTLAVFLAYRIARTIGFDMMTGFALAAIVAFQPKFAMYFTNINYDVLLIPLFFLFTLAGISSLKNGLGWKNFSLLFLSVILGFLTKGTAIVLLISFVVLVGFHLFNNVRDRKKFVLSLATFIFVLGLATIPFSSHYGLATLLPSKGGFGGTISALGDYMGKSLTPGHFALSSRTYWGSLGWNANFISDHFTDVMWLIEAIATVGLVSLLFRDRGAKYLPERKYIVFFILLTVALQLGIRAADFSVFLHTDKLDLGTPGRYFLPNLATHIILVFVGLGALLGTRERFRIALNVGVVTMVFFSLYLTLDVILPRFYL